MTGPAAPRPQRTPPPQLEGQATTADSAEMSIRRFLAAYVLLNAGLYVYSLVRYGLPPDAFSWGCAAFGVFVLVLLVRGSRGAWVLSFFGSTLALILGLAVLMHE